MCRSLIPRIRQYPRTSAILAVFALLILACGVEGSVHYDDACVNGERKAHVSLGNADDHAHTVQITVEGQADEKKEVPKNGPHIVELNIPKGQTRHVKIIDLDTENNDVVLDKEVSNMKC